MKPRPRLKTATTLFPITFMPFLNLLCLLLILHIVSPYYVLPNITGMNLPKTITSDFMPENTTVITITGEDVIYFENKVVSEQELKKTLRTQTHQKKPVLIKADGRSSLVRSFTIWNMCRELGLEKINIATTMGK